MSTPKPKNEIKLNSNGTPDSYREHKRLNVQKTYKLYIGGKFPRTESGRFYALKDVDDKLIANVCRSSRKDFRDAVVAARKAFADWSTRPAYNRGQVIYRIAEMLETRKAQFAEELQLTGIPQSEAIKEVEAAIDMLVYYAGWADKFQQIFGSVNPVASSHFNFSMCEPTGVVSVFAPEEKGLLGLIAAIIPAVTGGNTCVVLAAEKAPTVAISFAEALNSSDVPGGVVNILTGFRDELISHFSSHMDVNGMLYFGADKKQIQVIQEDSASNVKRAIIKQINDWSSEEETLTPYHILDTQEIKTTWHPVGV